MKDDAIDPGGMMRCCIKTIEDDTEKAEEGKQLKCAYGSTGTLLYTGGAWRYKPEEA